MKQMKQKKNQLQNLKNQERQENQKNQENQNQIQEASNIDKFPYSLSKLSLLDGLDFRIIFYDQFLFKTNPKHIFNRFT